jgi:hypothetical protein
LLVHYPLRLIVAFDAGGELFRIGGNSFDHVSWNYMAVDIDDRHYLNCSLGTSSLSIQVARAIVLSRSFLSTNIFLVEKALPTAFSVDHIFMSLRSLSLQVERAFTSNISSEAKELVPRL